MVKHTRKRQVNGSALKGQTDRNRSLLTQKRTDISQVGSRPKCPYCWHEFDRTRANQVFCKPSHKTMYCERRKAALVDALLQTMKAFGANVERVRRLALDTVDMHFRSVMKSLLLLGWWYDEKARQWEYGTLSSEKRTA